MKKSLCLALALALTGAPSFAAEFAEMPLGGEYRPGPIALTPGLSAQMPDLSIPVGQTMASLPVGESFAALEAARAQGATAQAAKASPRAELSAATTSSRSEEVYDGGKGNSRFSGSEVDASGFAGASGGGLGRYGGGGGGHRGGGGDGPRSPRNSGDENPLQKAWNWLKGVPNEWKIGVAAAVLISATLFGFYEHSKHRNDYWLHSHSHTEIVSIDNSRKSGDADTLRSIAEGVHERQNRMLARIDNAKKAKQDRVDDKTHDKVADAEHLAAFDGLVWSRARLNHNFVSADPQARLGEQSPSTWNSRETELEQDASASGSEGKLALSLRDLRGEVDREVSAEAALKTQIDGFESHVPYLFGGVMKGELQKGQADLKEFRDREIAPEDALWTAKNAAMRGRVSEKLYKADTAFHGHRDHRDALTDLFNAKVDPAYKTAAQIDSDLSGMISHRHSEATWMAIAAMHTHDAVDHSETTYDSKGNSHTRHWTTYEDHSGTYRALAAIESSAAASDARSANDGLQRLKPMVAALYGDKTIASEELRGMLPTVSGRGVGEGDWSLVSDLLFHPMFGFFGSLSSASSGESARTSLAPVLSSLRRLDGEVAGRRDGEINWVESAITTDLDAEMKDAARGAGRW